MSLRRYLQYKDSGVQWLGMVPDHWVVKPFKWVIERNDGGVWGDEPDGISDTLVLRSTEQTVAGCWKLDDPALRKLTESEKTFARLEAGDLLVTKSSGSSLHIGKTTLVTEDIAKLECCYSNFMQRIRLSDTFLPKLAWFVMNNDLARLQFDLLSNSTTGLANLNGTMIGKIILPVAPLLEQVEILTFLDYETAKIDELISEQKKLITLLAEKRQATISHAVTKGLNPNASMKESGVEWLGEVPEHWTVKNLRHFAAVLRGKFTHRPRNDPAFYDGDYPFVQTGDITGTDRYISSYKQTLNEKGAAVSKEFPKGTLVMAIAANVGDVAILDFAAFFPDSVVGLVPNHGTDLTYFYYLLGAMRKPMHQMATVSTQMNLNVEQITALIAGCPPLAEQESIVQFLDSEICRLDLLTVEATRGIGLLKERRSALISAAVTGKIDVRREVQQEPVTIQDAS